ncbi:MAG: transposase [Patescibacteria group bacterium]
MEMYHTLNRGVDKRKVVMDEEDRVRFVHDLYVFNDKHTAAHSALAARQVEGPRSLLVHIHAFCLMPNHYHLLLSPAVENGVPQFMKKLNMGYAKYFNEKYERSGALWQGKYKKKLIERDAHFLYIPYYIHLNALDLSLPQWREGKVRSVPQALKNLREYRWSSHLDYLGEHNFPSVTEREFLAQTIGTRSRYEKEIEKIITNAGLASGSNNLE